MSGHLRILVAAATALLVLHPASAILQAACTDRHGCADEGPDLPDHVSLLQAVYSLHGAHDSAGAVVAPQLHGTAGVRDLALVHVPYNFGHTIEKVGLLGSNASENAFDIVFTAASSIPIFGLNKTMGLTLQQKQTVIQSLMMPGGEQWGMLFPELSLISPHSGCPTYLTPQKYWPKDLQDRYFGNRTAFGLLRDPYERLVAIFRGDGDAAYGGSYPEFAARCDVNGAVKLMMKQYLNTSNKFAHGCVFVPQSEYFEGNDYDITLPVDNRLFPDSMNKVFLQHGYSDMLITTRDIIHVTNCNETWPGDLDGETRALVRQVYRRDFELLCDYFGYCDPAENTCLRKIPGMCPKKVIS